ncbi:MAG: GIY-YIG nuclease family protein [Patescibacteria group bacterium]
MSHKKLSETPGVYIFKDSRKKILYIGKAVNLKRRVSSYFQKAHDSRIEEMVGKIAKIEYKKTDSALEALLLEAECIKKHQPPYNILQKDDKTFLYVEFTKEKFSRPLLVRGHKKSNVRGQMSNVVFGPFLYAGAIREALRILRRIFPWSLHSPETIGAATRPCFDYEIGQCPGTCVGTADAKEYKKTIRKLKLFFRGKKKQIIRELEREMKETSKNLEFERASVLKRQIFSLKHIQDVAVLGEEKFRDSKLEIRDSAKRIEGYDISNISGASATGSIVVFEGNEPNKNEYRKFKILSITGPDDTGMLCEVLERRLKHREWPLPELIFVDGGKGQVNAVQAALLEAGRTIPVVGIAKGPERKKNEFFGKVPAWTSEDVLIRVRDEAHRFAISYHKHLRGKQFRRA